MAGANLFDPGVVLEGAVIEASYACENTPLLRQLDLQRVPRMIDPQTVRFTGSRYLETKSLLELPYAPETPITAENFNEAQALELTRSALLFQQDASVDHFTVPALPVRDQDFQLWIRHTDALLAAATALNGGKHLDRRPLIAQIAPGPMALRTPQFLVNRLIDYPIDGVYVQPLNLNPTSDSPEKLNQYVVFLRALVEAGIPVIASQVGAFGLVLQAMGISAFDSGLGMAESCNLARLTRPVTPKERARRSDGNSAGPKKRLYLHPLMTTLPADQAQVILSEQIGLKAKFVCTKGCCRFRGFEDLVDRGRNHYLWTRMDEVESLRAAATPGMKVEVAHKWLQDARETSRHVRRAALAHGLSVPSFKHLDAWIGVLERDVRARDII